MYVDVKFFKNVIHMLETNHNMIRLRDDVTEAWKFHVDQTIIQSKEVIKAAEYQEERDSVFSQFNEVMTQLENFGWYPVLKSESYINFDNEAEDDS